MSAWLCTCTHIYTQNTNLHPHGITSSRRPDVFCIPSQTHHWETSSFPLLFHHLSSHFSSPPPSLQLSQFSVASVSLISTSSPPRHSTPHLPPLSVAAILVLGGGHGHASLSGLINHPRSWQPGLHRGPMAWFFLPQKTRILSSTFSLAVVPHDQG